MDNVRREVVDLSPVPTCGTADARAGLLVNPNKPTNEKQSCAANGAMNFIANMVSFAAMTPDQDVDADDCLSDDQTSDENDDPRLSAAALCISFRFANEGNDAEDVYCGPEFTHQCFEGEFIPGYQPFQQDMEQRCLEFQAEANREESEPSPIVPHHPSHRHFEEATAYLRILVEMAPSCSICKVVFKSQRKKPEMENAQSEILERQVKRQRVSEPDRAEVESERKEKRHAETMDLCNDDSNSDPTRMPLSQVKECLQKMLPRIVETSTDVRNKYLSSPFGVVLHEYDRGLRGQFCISLASGKKTSGVESYHSSVQKLALGWIETADDIDVAYQPHSGQYWQILYLFQKHDPEKYSFVGYMTLWTVTSLFTRPHHGLILRITQVLLLPQHQRCGHGQEMLRVIYKFAHGDFDKSLEKSEELSDRLYPIVQVNVEDPSAGFTGLRDLVDYMMFWENQEWRDLLSNDDNQDCGYSRLQEIAGRVKIAPRQVQIIWELHRLRKLLVQKGSNIYKMETVISGERSDEKHFRLAVKERLYNENRSTISSLPTKSDMRDEISKLFDQQMKHYERILAKAHVDSGN